MSATGGAEDRDGPSVTHLDAQQVRLINDNGKARPTQNSVNPPWEVLHLMTLFNLYSCAGRWHRAVEDCWVSNV